MALSQLQGARIPPASAMLITARKGKGATRIKMAKGLAEGPN
jgi:hypothetical protein